MTRVQSLLERITGWLRPIAGARSGSPVAPIARSTGVRRAESIRRTSPAFQPLEDRVTPTSGLGFALTFGSTGVDDPYVITVDGNGYLYAAGGFQGTVDFDPGPGSNSLSTGSGSDGWLAKYAPTGDLLWVRQFAGTGHIGLTNIIVDETGAITAGGGFEGTVDFDPGLGTTNQSSSGLQDACVVRLNADGVFQWVRRWGAAADDSVTGIDLDPSGNLWISSNFVGTVDFDGTGNVVNRTSAGQADAAISKLDRQGNLILVSTFGGANVDYVWELVALADGGVAVAGNFNTTTDLDPSNATLTLNADGINGGATFLSRLDWNGNLVWGVRQSDGGFLTGLKVDGGGHLILTSRFGGIGNNVSMDADPGPGVVRLVSQGNVDSQVSKFDPSGRLLWARGFGGAEDDSSSDLAVDKNGRIFVTGDFRGTVDFDSGPATTLRTSNGSRDSFVLTLGADGGFLRVDSFGSLFDDFGNALAVDRLGNVFAVGSFQGTVDFDPSAGVVSRSSAGQYDAYFIKLADRPDLLARDGTGVWHQGHYDSPTTLFTSPIGMWNEASNWRDVRSGDFSGDGVADILGRTATGEWWLSQQTRTGQLANRPFGAWNEGAGWRDILSGDFNRDGRLDLVARTAQGVWHLGRNTATGFVFEVIGAWNEAATWRDVNLADMDGDGWLDLIGRTATGQWWVGLANDTGYLANMFWSQWNEAAGWSDVRILDLTGDGRQDVVGRTGGSWWVGRNLSANGPGIENFAYTNWVNWNPAANWRDTRFADFNGDGRLDLGSRTGSGQWFVFLNAGGTGFTFPSSPWAAWNEAANWGSVRSDDVDGDGRADLIGRASDGKWYLARSTGSAFTTTEWGVLSGGSQDIQFTRFRRG
jgi:hypothetical protein